jgi:hypothetical protein
MLRRSDAKGCMIMTDKKKKHTGPKPWRGRVVRVRSEKIRTRKHWTRARWHKYYDTRDARREAPPRPYRMYLRLERQALAVQAARRRARRAE